MEMMQWTKETRRQEKFKDITKLIEKSPYLKIKRREFNYPECILEFEDPKTAILFAINFVDAPSTNYFPMGNKLVKIHYNRSYVYGLCSLSEYADQLKNRKVVCLVDGEWLPTRLTAPIPREYTDQQSQLERESHARQIKTKCVEHGINPEELIICYISGWGGEDLYGTLGGFSLREQGYIVFPEDTLGAPFVDLAGVPDLVAVKLGAFQDRLIEEGIIEHGAWLPELELQKIFGKCTRSGKIEEEKSLAIEVEPAPDRASGGRGQLRSFVSTSHFNQGILICPGRAELDKNYEREFGYITWDDMNKEDSFLPEITYHRDEKLAELLTTSKRVASLILVKNTALEELLQTWGNKSVFEVSRDFIKSSGK